MHGLKVVKTLLLKGGRTFSFGLFWETRFPDGSVVKNPPAVQETQEMQVQPPGWEDPLEKETAIHSSILAWEIWTEEPGELQSMRLQGVRHN